MTEVRINFDGETIENWAEEAERTLMDNGEQFVETASQFMDGAVETVTYSDREMYIEWGYTEEEADMYSYEYSYDTTNWGTVFHNVFTTETMSQLIQIAQERYELENQLREEAANYVSESITIDGVPLMSLMEIPEISFTYD